MNLFLGDHRWYCIEAMLPSIRTLVLDLHYTIGSGNVLLDMS